jgi:hypothetical protein
MRALGDAPRARTARQIVSPTRRTTLDRGLRDEHPIERIAVVGWQLGDGESMRLRRFQRMDRLIRQHAGNQSSWRP